jgi:hypothetical protein
MWQLTSQIPDAHIAGRSLTVDAGKNIAYLEITKA